MSGGIEDSVLVDKEAVHSSYALYLQDKESIITDMRNMVRDIVRRLEV
jgi:hypothetical protein